MPALQPLSLSPADWWNHAVLYQIYPRSFADSNGDGIGDIPGIISKLPHIADLGVDALWLSPFYTSPQKDAGYDVADYCNVDPIFGSLSDAEKLIETAHEYGLRIIVDVVPNHSSDQHPWFQKALAAKPGSRERARYMFREGKGVAGDLPPNNWESVFGGPAWTRVAESDGSPGQWYLHLFDASQPDFDWKNPEVWELFRSVLTFWLDRGVDGFRVDVAHGLIKAEGLPDEEKLHHPPLGNSGPFWDQEGVHAVYQEWRKILESYGPDKMLCAEAWVMPLPKWHTTSEVMKCTKPSILVTSPPASKPKPSDPSSMNPWQRLVVWEAPAPGCCPTTTSFDMPPAWGQTLSPKANRPELGRARRRSPMPCWGCARREQPPHSCLLFLAAPIFTRARN